MGRQGCAPTKWLAWRHPAPAARTAHVSQRASTAAIARVERYYTDAMMFDSYRQVYRKAMQGSANETDTETH